MKVILLILSILMVSCESMMDEQLVAKRLDQNNELLEKQVNLLQRTFVLTSAEESNNPAKTLFNQSSEWMEDLEKELHNYQNAEQSTALFKKMTNRFNDSMKKHSGLLIDWTPASAEFADNELLRSWKSNNFLLLQLAMIEKCMELYEAKSQAATESLVPVVYSSQFYQVQKGNNAIFDVAFKSKRPELVEIKISKARLDGKPINLKNIEVDRYTQRFILFSLDKGNYVIEGDLILVNTRGIKESYPFSQSFYVH